jgi:hypothetical protein
MLRTLALTLILTVGLAAQASKTIADADAKLKAGDADAAITLLDAELKKGNAKDAPALKTALAKAHFAAGDKSMNDEKLPPFRKYPAALRSFRKTLEYDKNHAKAKENIATIEGIYKSMGRPVPQ